MPNDPEGMMLRDPAVFQPFHCVSNVALHGRAKTVAAVIVHTKIQFFKSSILNLKVVSGFRALVTSSWHLVRVTPRLSLTTTDLEC